MTDAQLVARVRRGDTEAFGELAGRYERTLLAVAVAKLRDFHAAEDVVQSALLLAFRRLDTLRDAARFGPWVVRIVNTQAIEVARGRRVPASIPLHDTEPAAAEAQPPAWVDEEHLLTLVARLPERERMLVGLRYFDGHSMAEIAELSARPLGTVTKQLSRATARLRAWWNAGERR